VFVCCVEDSDDRIGGVMGVGRNNSAESRFRVKTAVEIVNG